MSATPPPSDVELLLRGMHGSLTLDEGRWERVLRIARATGLHARLAATNAHQPGLSAVLRRHFLSASRIAAFRSQMVRAELFQLAPLCAVEHPVIVLKGGAYLLQERPMTVGRFVSDVDLMVPRDALRAMEQRLRAAGWQTEELSAYDERYYRDWSHETPPMRYPGHALELDLHHAITPVTGSLAFDPAPLFERSVAIPGTPFRVLAAEDQLLHACVHCFHDGDLALRIRELVDIDALLRESAADDGFWATLLARAEELGLQRPLWYGLHFAITLMACPVPDEVMTGLPRPAGLTIQLMDRLVPLAMLPTDPDGPPPLGARLARAAMLARYHLLRMPLHMLVPHLARKASLRLRARIAEKKEAPDDGAP